MAAEQQGARGEQQGAPGEQQGAPPVGATPAISWQFIFLVGVSHVAMLPIPAIGALLHVNVLGAAFSLTPAAVLLGAALGILLRLLTILPVIYQTLWSPKPVSQMQEGNTFTLFLCYLMFGARRNLGHICKVVLAGTIVSAFVGIMEELVFRGTLQTGLCMLLKAAGVPSTAMQLLAIGLSSVIFVLAHGPSASFSHFIISIYLGSLFAVTGNIVVPMLGHLVVNLVTFMQGYYLVAFTLGDAERASLLKTDKLDPYKARGLRAAAGYK